MTTIQNVLDVARSLIGIHETPDGSNIAHPITDWATQYGYSSGDAWCSWTVSYEFYHTGGGAALIYNHPSGYSGDFRTMGKQHGLMVPGPVPGAIDVMDFDGKPDFTDHVGIVESVNADGSWVNIEGNHNNQVMRVTRKPGGGSHWFILPKYAEVSDKPKEDEMFLYSGEPYQVDDSSFIFPDCWRDKCEYYILTDASSGKAVNVRFRLIGHDGGDATTEPQDVPGKDGKFIKSHNLQDILRQERFKNVKGSVKLIATAESPCKFSLREVPK
jgi:hypothetical protein